MKRKPRDFFEFIYIGGREDMPRMQSVAEYRDTHPEIVREAQKLARTVGGRWQNHFLDLYREERDRLYAEWDKWHGKPPVLTEPESTPTFVLEP